ncbi:MAG: hypothetical protein ACRCR9_01135 [Chitinophagaceae bacterium]
MFVRISSLGIPLTVDDLIYSIYKANFPEAKEAIDKIGMNFVAPTQILSMLTRIVASDLNENKYVKKMVVKDFQSRIKNEEFKKKLGSIGKNHLII